MNHGLRSGVIVLNFKDSFRRARMAVTPPSSRSFQRVTEHLMSESAQTLESIRAIESRLTSLEQSVLRVSDSIAVSDERARLRFEALYAQPNEDAEHAKRRFFASIPEATGNKRKLQLANARLMSEFDRICRNLNLDYWFSYGTLVASLSRSGFIPWDDDIDLCMMREDIASLSKALESDSDYQLTLVYDWFSPCRQIRFTSRNPMVPCFIDVSIYDWSCSYSPEDDSALRALRLELMDCIHNSADRFAYWAEAGWLLAPGSGEVAQSSQVDFANQDATLSASESCKIEAEFARFQNKAYDLGLIRDREKAEGISYALDNTYDAPWRRIIWPCDMVFPTENHPFESYEFKVPHDAESVADECYPGWPYLPSDILAHNHFDDALLSNGAVISAIDDFIG